MARSRNEVRELPKHTYDLCMHDGDVRMMNYESNIVTITSTIRSVQLGSVLRIDVQVGALGCWI